MRILLATSANAGHFGPMLPYAAAYRRAGHEVLVAAPGSFAAAVERAGYPLWACPDADPDEWTAVRERFLAADPDRRNEVMVTLGAELEARSFLPGVLAAVDDWRPDLILREIGELGSALAAELRGVPRAQVLIGLDKFVDFTLPLAATALARYRTTLGLPADPGGGYLHRQPSLSLLPPSFEEPRPTPGPRVHRFRAPEPPTAPLPAHWWPEQEAPLVYVTFGTVAGGVPFAAAAFRTVVEAVAELPVRLLVTTGDGGDPADWAGLPPNAHVERWVPQRDALAQASAMVCHGGTGTVLGALSAGVPLVVVPQFADQPDNAARVAATGAGLAIGGGEPAPATVDEVRTAVTTILTEPAYRHATAVLATEIAALPPADDVVGLLALEFSGGGGRSR